jgi:hypothetical protein
MKIKLYGCCEERESGDVAFDVFAYVAGCEVVEVEPK